MFIHLYLFVLVIFSKVYASDAFKCNITVDLTSTTGDCSRLELHKPPEHLQNQGLQKLLLSHNNLQSSITFANWSKLLELDVSSNDIRNISRDTFKDLSRLKVLNISHNNIQYINEMAFDKLIVLEVLDLSGNPLLGIEHKHLHESLINILHLSLRKLIITSSNLTILSEDFFHDTLELQYLDLSKNHFIHIPVLPSSLIYFDISNNSITDISIVPFQGALHLKVLKVEYNLNLTEIDIDAFEALKEIRNISFKGCKSLEHLPPNLFYFCTKLQFLSLADCSLKTLPISYRAKFLETPVIDLHNNPWVCNGSTKWFISLKSANNVDLRCERPINITIYEYFGTDLRRSALQRLLLLLIILVFTLFGLAIYISFIKEKKKRAALAYLPLGLTKGGKQHPLNNPVYITTVEQTRV